MPWRVRRSNLVLSNRWARVRRDECELPDGHLIGDYYYWEGGDFAQVFAITAAEEIVLTRQYKHGVKEVVLELPAGLIEASDRKPLATAKRELREETGFTGGRWLPLGRFNVSSAKAATRSHSFLANGVARKHEQRADPKEVVDVTLVGKSELCELIAAGAIRDANSIATSFRAFQVLGWGL